MNEEATQYRRQRWDAYPLHAIKREIEGLQGLTPEQRAHLAGWIDRLMDRIADPHDFARQTEARSLATTYAGVVQAQSRALALKPGSKGADAAWALCMKLQDHLRKCLRTLGLRPAGKSKGGKTGEGTIFSPPRPPAKSELSASALYGPEDGD